MSKDSEIADALSQVLENQGPQYKQLLELLNKISPEYI